ncbi:MAG: MarR family EPS-associated transcriptional regulator [Deltaproteobacteria bacterium]|nr:MarR family EPS-associated transcriptional regulator [Deltaproteobacteria bacterium]
MNLESEEVLKLLREIKKTPQMTQRELSSSLGISLGKVNFLIKALVHKGFIKANNFKNSNNKAAYFYLLTPRGLEEKARITYHLLILKTQEYKRLKEEIQALEKEIGSIGISDNIANK